MLDCLRFIFKDKQYEYEKEVRIVKTSENHNFDEKMNVTKLYIEIERDIKNCKEVILGTNYTDKTEIATYIYKNVGNEIDVTISNVEYK